MKKDKKTNKYIFEYKMGFITLVSLILFLLPIFLLEIFPLKIDMESIFESMTMSEMVLAFLMLFLWMVLHEIIHGTFYQINGAKSENIKYGVALEKGIFYCKCGEFISKKNILMSVIAPFVLIGVVTYIIGIALNSWLLLFLSIVNISGAAGDITMFLFFIKQDKDLRFKELGDSTTFCLETKDDLSDKKFLGVKLKKIVETDNEIWEEKCKKITISKASLIILLVFSIFLLIPLILELLL